VADAEHPRKLTGVVVEDARGDRRMVPGAVVFSTMPIQSLVRGLRPTLPAPPDIYAISEGLEYRDFITVGLLLDRLTLQGADGPLLDNWLYIQDPRVRVGRIQLFHNWSPYLIKDPGKAWIGLEYFCNRGDDLWSKTNDEMIRLALDEIERIGIGHRSTSRDGVVIRMPRTYPAYFGTYGQFSTLQRWVDQIENLYLIGRNGMHRYNNQDHSMLTAMVAVDNLVAGRTDRSNIWAVNTEPEYHEERSR
ncbi:MAG: hypothetical protein AAFV53_43880, partial [Myxococcota bacterium]